MFFSRRLGQLAIGGAVGLLFGASLLYSLDPALRRVLAGPPVRLPRRRPRRPPARRRATPCRPAPRGAGSPRRARASDLAAVRLRRGPFLPRPAGRADQLALEAAAGAPPAKDVLGGLLDTPSRVYATAATSTRRGTGRPCSIATSARRTCAGCWPGTCRRVAPPQSRRPRGHRSRRGSRSAAGGVLEHAARDRRDDRRTGLAGRVRAAAVQLPGSARSARSPPRYAAALDALDAAPADVVFLDDRLQNVVGAREAGMRAELFTDAAQIDAIRRARAVAPGCTAWRRDR